MIMKNFVLTLGLLLLCNFTFSQNNGYFGKKNYIEVNGIGNIPIFSNMFDSYDLYSYKIQGNSLVDRKDYFNQGLLISVGRTLGRNLSLSFEYGQSYASIKTPGEMGDWYEDEYIQFRHELIDIQTKSFIPKIEFTRQGGLLPIGFNHQLGFGYTNTSIIEKDYKLVVTSSETPPTEEQMTKLTDKFIDFDQKYSGFVFLYSFNIRTPITKSLMINYGMRYTFNFRNFADYYSSNDTYVYSNYRVASEIGKTRIYNFINFNLGLTYVF